ncbi:hypothetical protein ACWDKQ_23885 [Saccharopolyspora sp. NPDC000995]
MSGDLNCLDVQGAFLSFGAWVFVVSEDVNGVGGEEASYCTGRAGAEVVVEFVAGSCQICCLQVGGARP